MDEPSVLVQLFILFAAAKVLGELFEHVHQPAVVGEILAGVIVGPNVLGLAGGGDGVLGTVAQLGLVVLMFTVGLETDAGELSRVGRPALLVGVLGVILPFAGALGVMVLFGYPTKEGLFVAAALAATSVGVTARVLRDVGAVRSVPGRVILGAAVVDDVLALILLSVLSVVVAGEASTLGLVLTVVEAVAFLVLVLVAGPRLSRALTRLVRVPGIPDSPFLVAVLLTLGLAALSETIGLAAIVGAFLAGLVFEFRREEVVGQVEPVYELLVPFFFGVIGSRLNPAAFADPAVLALTAAIIAVAILGKMIGGSLGAVSLGRPRSLVVGAGMIPRGGADLVVASIGLGLGILHRPLYSVIIAMSVVTALFGPFILGPLLRRARARESGEDQAEAQDA